jgi:2-polyprenyl-6-methoxyphenol hydroxylase-like FAD-dependent oxidoreductase
MLSPNALRVLDSLGVYDRIKNKGYHFEVLYFTNENGETTGRYYFGHEELYGYKALRIYREVLIDELKLILEELQIPVIYGKKYSHVIEERDDEVKFQFSDGTISTTSLLIGADGIHSKVRQHIAPEIEKKYSGAIGITSDIEKSKIRFPQNDSFPLPTSISAKAGAFVLAPQDVDGQEILIGTQRRYPEQDRKGWERLTADKAELGRLLRMNQTEWPDIVQSAMENVSEERINVWPFYVIPRLSTWSSPSKRIVILGDAAHAIPPTAGQGVNQAFEDVYTLALLLSKLSSKISIENALEFWQSFRQARVDKILHLTMLMNNKRLPDAEQARLPKDQVWQDDSATAGEGRQLAWLYEPDLKQEIDVWAGNQDL